MASLLMHLAATCLAMRELGISDAQLLIGAVLPDFGTRGNAHYRVGDRRVTIDLMHAAEELKPDKDSMCLGYMLHLAQDIAFRRYLTEARGIKLTRRNTQRLHEDYAALNRCLAERYALKIPNVPTEVSTAIADRFAPSLGALRTELERDFSAEVPAGHSFRVMDKASADAFIDHAAQITAAQIKSLQASGRPYAEAQYYWKVPHRSGVWVKVKRKLRAAKRRMCRLLSGRHC